MKQILKRGMWDKRVKLTRFTCITVFLSFKTLALLGTQIMAAGQGEGLKALFLLLNGWWCFFTGLLVNLGFLVVTLSFFNADGRLKNLLGLFLTRILLILWFRGVGRVALVAVLEIKTQIVSTQKNMNRATEF